MSLIFIKITGKYLNLLLVSGQSAICRHNVNIGTTCPALAGRLAIVKIRKSSFFSPAWLGNAVKVKVLSVLSAPPQKRACLTIPVNQIWSKNHCTGQWPGILTITPYLTIPHIFFRQVFPQEAPNSTNIDEVIKKAGDNDSELTEINLNNIKYISDEKWANLFKSLAENSNVESLSAANCNLTDPICNLLCNCLEVEIKIENENYPFLCLINNKQVNPGSEPQLFQFI